MNSRALHVIGALVRVRPEAEPALRIWLEAQAQMEVVANNDRGTLVLILEGPDDAVLLDLMDGLRDRPGVLDVQFVYHRCLQAEEVAACD